LPLGFDRPSVPHSSAGCCFSANTVGHLGFTGVSFWMDLEKDACVILLANRVHPFRWNSRLVQFRPQIHNRVMEHFEI
jgi:CubicO group peptidase (beta-lactamase class C family)